VKNNAPTEWQKFKIDMEKKIIANDQKIKSIKLNSTTTQKMTRQLNNLEEANNDLKIQLAIFNEEVIVKWQNFKTAMNHNVKKIGIEVEDISMK
jgi:3-methyladenine DNA glycosylase Tag